MPVAKLNLDFDTRKFSDSQGTIISAMTGKKDSIREYELSVIQNGTPLTLPDDTVIIAALKQTSVAAGSLLTSSTAVKSGWGSGTRWTFRLEMTGPTFNPPIPGTKVDFDIMILLSDGQQFMSLTIPFAIEKAVQVPP